MYESENLLKEIFNSAALISATLSGVRKGTEKNFNKVMVKPFLSSGKVLFQFAYVYDKKTTHKNLDAEQSICEFLNLINTYFKQAVLFSRDNDFQILKHQNGSEKIIKTKPTKSSADIQSHNRKKNYIIEDGFPCDFLIKLGVMDSMGKVLKTKYDKFKQINKYLEIIASSIDIFKNKDSINIIDFGSGKAYLTFALYWYFTSVLEKKVTIAGLDLKSDVVDYCNSVARDLKYDSLTFYKGEIKDFSLLSDVDMVVTLHACDTATDDAIVQALKWKSKLIMMVPCCQHELFDKIFNPVMKPMTKHGIVKERLSSLITDSIRGMLLETQGYNVEIFEFIDMEHTPKNILIRASFTGNYSDKAREEYQAFRDFWKIDSYLEKNINNIKK